MLKLIKKYPELLSFGILTAMFSGPGQTFLVSLFIPEMKKEFGMSLTQISTLYSIATLLSACTNSLTSEVRAGDACCFRGGR